MTDPALSRQMDSTDVCQSVMADFFVRTALDQFDLQSPKQLIGLLAIDPDEAVAGLAVADLLGEQLADGRARPDLDVVGEPTRR